MKSSLNSQKPAEKVLRHGNVIRGGFHSTKNSLNLNSLKQSAINLKLFSTCNVYYQDQRDDEATGQERQLPVLFYIQNPITWLINKIDFFMLRKAWDPDFVEDEFKRGVREAVSVICTLISMNLWTDLRGLISGKALTRLQRDVEVNWSEEEKKIIALSPSDIKMILPRKLHFLRIADHKFVDIDVICVAMKFKSQDPSEADDVILIEVLTRFHRNYTLGKPPRWVVSLFKLSSRDVRKKGKTASF